MGCVGDTVRLSDKAGGPEIEICCRSPIGDSSEPVICRKRSGDQASEIVSFEKKNSVPRDEDVVKNSESLKLKVFAP